MLAANGAFESSAGTYKIEDQHLARLQEGGAYRNLHSRD